MRETFRGLAFTSEKKYVYNLISDLQKGCLKKSKAVYVFRLCLISKDKQSTLKRVPNSTSNVVIQNYRSKLLLLVNFFPQLPITVLKFTRIWKRKMLSNGRKSL